MRILCVGDSIVAGYPFSEEYSFPYVLAKETGWDIINGGFEKGTIKDTMDALPQQIADVHPEAVMILCGSNDALYGASDARNIYRNMLQLVQKVLMSGAIPILVTPPLCFPHQVPASNAGEITIGMHCGVNLEEHLYQKTSIILQEIRDFMVRDWEGSPVYFVDLMELFKEYSKLHDGLHATKDGYEYIGHVIAEQLKDVL